MMQVPAPSPTYLPGSPVRDFTSSPAAVVVDTIVRIVEVASRSLRRTDPTRSTIRPDKGRSACRLSSRWRPREHRHRYDPFGLKRCVFSTGPFVFYSAGSSECCRYAERRAANEQTPIRPRGPFAVAKGTAHWLVANHRAAYGLHASTDYIDQS
jgi:hypothetical protein